MKNLLMICLDALNPSRLRLNGGPVATPNIEEFAESNVHFKNAWASGPKTWISFASIMTGLCPDHHGVVSDICGLRTEIPTLPEAFNNYGFRTAAWPGCAITGKDFRICRGFQEYYEGSYVIKDGPYGAGFSDFDAVLDEFEDWWNKPNDTRLKFAFLHYFGIHHMPPKAWDYFDQKVVDRSYVRQISDVQKNENEQHYNAKIALADEYFGKIWDIVDGQKGHYDDTIIVLFSDHGEDLSMKVRPYPMHDRCTEDELRSLLVISDEEEVSEREEVVRLMDIYPTVIRSCLPPAAEHLYLSEIDALDLYTKPPYSRAVHAINMTPETLDEPSRLTIGNCIVRDRTKESDIIKGQLRALGYLSDEEGQ